MKKHFLIFSIILVSTFCCFAQSNSNVDTTNAIVVQATAVVMDTSYAPVKLATITDTQAYKMGMKDAQNKDNFNDGSGVASFLSAAVFTPIYGILPTIFYTVKKPNNKYFKYPQNAPIDQTAYTKGFEKKALQLRKTRALTGYSIATAGWTAFIGVFIQAFNRSGH